MQGSVASDLAALEAIWRMYLRNNITQPGAWKVALREKCPSCVVCRSYFVHSTKWRSLKERCFHRLSKAPRNFHQTEVESLVWCGYSNQRGHIGQKREQRAEALLRVCRHDLLWKLVVFKNSHSALISFMCKVTALLPLLTIRPFVYLATCIFSCEWISAANLSVDRFDGFSFYCGVNKSTGKHHTYHKFL